MMLRGFCAFSALVIATAAVAGEAPNAAHQIAQKFAAPTESAPPEAAKPASAKPAVVKTEAPKAAATKPIAAATERPPLDYEMEMLRRARAEREAAAGAKAEPKQAAAPVVTPAATAATKPLEPAPAPAVTPAAPPAAAPIQAPALAPALAPAVAAPPPAVKAAEAAPAAAPPSAPAKSEVKAPEVKAEAKPAVAAPAAIPPAPPAVTASGPVSRASILLAIETGGASSRSGPSPSFDPIVCMADECFVSAGLNADAVKLSKSDALKLKTTSEASPDSCKNKVACVYRNVSIPGGAQLQVIELGSASHEPSRTSDATPDKSCKATDGNLMCDHPIATPDFKIWVVPEETARAAGVQSIEDAIADGLPHIDMARATDK